MNRKNSVYIIAALMGAILIMSIGFALTSYTQLLEINGSSVTIKNASWNVHFNQNSYAETTGSVTGTHSLNNTLFNYSVTLSPNEFYSAEFDVVNDGTFDAELKSIVMTPTLTADDLSYLNYYIVYAGNTYTESQVFSTGLSLPANATKHIKVYINYFTNESNADSLPDEDHTLNLSIALNYNQV